MLVASIGRALGLLSCLYCLLTFYLAVVFIAKDDEVEMSDIRFGAIMVAGLASVISFGWNSLSLGSFLVLLCLVVAVVFSTYAIEVGLIVRQAAIATVLFLVMYCPGVWAIHYFLNWLVTDAVTG